LIDENISTEDVTVDCREFLELISEAVDDRLLSDLKHQFIHHASICLPCRNEYEVDQITKSIVRTTVHRREVPSELYYAVLTEVKKSQSSQRSWLEVIFGEAFLNPAVALVALIMVAVGAVSLLQRENAVPISADKNIIAQSINNYSATMAGVLKPTFISHDPGDVKDYLAKDTPFEVDVAALSGCDWCGGVLSSFNGVKLAHVVYKIGGEGLLYVYQVDINEAMHGTRISLPENAKASLAKTGWYFEQTYDKCNVVLWRHKNTLCAAVSMIEREKMVALLGEKAPW